MDKAYWRGKGDALNLVLITLDAEILIRAHAAGGPHGADQAVVFPGAGSCWRDAGVEAGDIAFAVGCGAYSAIRGARTTGGNLVGAANIDLFPGFFIAAGIGIAITLRRIAGDVAAFAGHHTGRCLGWVKQRPGRIDR